MTLYYRFKDVGRWSLNATGDEVIDLKQPLVMDPVTQAMNLQGRTLTGAVINNWPFYGVKVTENGTVIDDAGIDTMIIRVLSDKMNFK